jgi:hypothetical protein
MKHTFCLLTLAAAAMLVSPAFAQESQHCYGIGVYTTDSGSSNRHYDTTVCEFSDGRANVSTLHGDAYSSDWYTPEQWQTAKAAVLASADKEVAAWEAKRKASDKAEDERFAKEEAQIEQDAAARKITNKKKCLAAGFDWHLYGCSVKDAK